MTENKTSRQYAPLFLNINKADPVLVGLVVFLPQGVDVSIARESRQMVLNAYPKARVQEIFAKLPKLLSQVAGDGSVQSRYDRLSNDDGIRLGPISKITFTDTHSYEHSLSRTLSGAMQQIAKERADASFTPFTYW